MVGRAGKNVCPPLFHLSPGNPRCRYAWFVPKQISNLRGEVDASHGVTGHEYKCGSRHTRLAPFNERGRVERGAECCDAFRKFFPRPTHTLLRFVGDDSAWHRHENSFLKKAERLAGAEKRAESNRLNPAEKRPRESAFPRATTLRTFRSRC